MTNAALRALFGVVAAAVLGTARAHADVITPEADTFIEADDSGGARGADTSLWTRNQTGNDGNDRVTLLRFDIGTYTASHGAASEAELFLSILSWSQLSNTTETYLVFGIGDGHGGEDFAEATYLWSDGEADGMVDATQGNLLPSGEPGTDIVGLGSFDLTAGSPGGAVNEDSITFSSQSLLDFMNADANNLVTLMVVAEDDSHTTAFASRESSTPPTLTIIPEPSPLAYLLLGSLAYFCRRRRPGPSAP
jgi:hypothetical protein